jgi:WD40 repeat protein
LASALAAVATPLSAQGIPQLGPSRTFQLPADSQVGEPSVVTAVAISPDGRLIAAAGDDHLVHLWSLADSRHIHTLRGHIDWIRSLSFSMEGTRLASAGDDHRICVWDIPSGRLSKTLGGNDRAIYCVRYSPDGRSLATVGYDRQLKLYEAATGDLATVLACPGADMRAVTFSNDGSLMATAGRNGQVRVWNTAEMAKVFDRDAQDRRIRALAFSSDGSHLAIAGEMPHVIFLDSRNGQALGSLPNPAGRVLAMVYVAPHMLATGSSDNSIQLWDVTTGREERRLLGHQGSVSSLAFEPRSGLLVSGSFDTTVRVWQLAGEGQQTTLTPGSPPVR